ncbi:hypothetical protein AAMO2058_001712000 [Amorphochlora amoebiformis]
MEEEPPTKLLRDAPRVEAQMESENKKNTKRKMTPDDNDLGKKKFCEMQGFQHRRKSKIKREVEEEKPAEAEWERKDDNDSLNDLLKTFANMVIPKNDTETCPLCFNTFKLEEFSAHVHRCLEKMESNVKSEWTVDTTDDSRLFSAGDCKFGIHCQVTTADHFRFMRHPKVVCPICNEKFHMHEINAHINFCLDKGGEQDMETVQKGAADSSSSGQMSTQQMAACAKAILDAKSTSENDVSLVSMLQRFKSLGFTRESLKNRLKEIKSSEKKMEGTSSSGSTNSLSPEQCRSEFDLKPPSFTFQGIETATKDAESKSPCANNT